MANVLTKNELFALIQSNLPSNNSKNITAAKLREVIEDFVTSNLSFQLLSITTTPVSVDVEIDFILIKSGADVINLPPIADYKERSLIIFNVSGFSITINADGSETIGGGSSLIVPDKTAIAFAVNQTASDWDDTLTVRKRVSITAGDEGNVLVTTMPITPGDFVDINCTLGASGPSGEFSVSGNQITWNGKHSIDVEIDWSFSGITAFNDKEIAGKLIKNFGQGSEVILANRTTSNFHTTKINAGTLFARTTLITGDIIHYVIANETDSVDTTITDQSTQIDEIR